MSEPISVCELKAGERGSYYAAYERLTREIYDCCEQQYSPLVPRLKRLLTLFLQAHFGDAHNYGEYAETIQDLTYNVEDPSSSTLRVIQAHTYVPGVEEKQNAIIVEIVSISSSKKVIGDYAGSSDDNGTERRVREKVTGVKIHCQSNDADKAAILAETAADFLTSVRESLMNALSLSAMDVLGCEPYKKKEPPVPSGIFVWSVILSLRHNHSVYVTTEGHRLKTFALDLRSHIGES